MFLDQVVHWVVWPSRGDLIYLFMYLLTRHFNPCGDVTHAATCRSTVQDLFNILGALYLAVLFLAFINAMSCQAPVAFERSVCSLYTKVSDHVGQISGMSCRSMHYLHIIFIHCLQFCIPTTIPLLLHTHDIGAFHILSHILTFPCIQKCAIIIMVAQSGYMSIWKYGLSQNSLQWTQPTMATCRCRIVR